MPAPNERDALLADLAAARQVLDDMGLRRTFVFTRVRRWYTPSSGAPWAPSGVLGRGVPVDVETKVSPVPRVRQVSTHAIVASGGRFQVGDIKVDKITPRLDPSVGVELTVFAQATAHADEERHLILVERSGTPWHVREGTPRLLVSAPYNEASAVTCVNALRAAMRPHWVDPYAHATTDSSPPPGADATNFASALTLANLLRATWIAHRSNAVLAQHPELDAYPLSAPVATTDGSTLALLHDLLRAFNAHAAEGPVRECEVVEAHGDLSFTHSLIVRPTRRTP